MQPRTALAIDDLFAILFHAAGGIARVNDKLGVLSRSFIGGKQPRLYH